MFPLWRRNHTGRQQYKNSKKGSIQECIRKDNMDCFRRCNAAYKGGVRGGEGGNDGWCQGDCYFEQKKKNTQKKHAAEAAAKLTAPFFQITSNRNIRSSRRMMTTTVAVGGTTRMACCWGRGIGHRWDGGHQAGRRMGWERPTWCMSAGWSLVSKIPVCLKVL